MGCCGGDSDGKGGKKVFNVFFEFCKTTKSLYFLKYLCQTFQLKNVYGLNLKKKPSVHLKKY